MGGNLWNDRFGGFLHSFLDVFCIGAAMEMGNSLFSFSLCLSYKHENKERKVLRKSAVGDVQITMKRERGNTEGKLEGVVRDTE